MSRLSPTESLLMSPSAFDIPTLTPCQRAICRVKDGVPLDDLATHPDVVTAFGGLDAVDKLEMLGKFGVRPAELCVIAGIRTFKSVFAAASAIELSRSVDCSTLGPGDIVRIPIFSLKLSIKAVLTHLIGNLQAKPGLRKILAEAPGTNSVQLLHPSGRRIIVEQVAIGGAGGSMVSDFHAGDIGDEVPRMVGEEDGARNFDEMRRASAGRRLPGGQAIWIGSPHAPFGPAYTMVQEYFGHPSKDMVVVRGTGPVLNPIWWTPERCEDLRRRDPEAYRTDVLGEFAEPESSLLTAVELDATTRRAPVVLMPVPGWNYVAAVDPATRGNAFTLVVLGKRPDGVSTVVLVQQWVGSKAAPLSLDAVFCSVASILRVYRVFHACSDQWSADANREIAHRHGLHLIERAWTQQLKLERFDSLRIAISERKLELSPDPVLRADLLSIRKRVTQSGVSIELPKTSDGRHADYAPALAMAFGEYCAPPDNVITDEGEKMIQTMLARANKSAFSNLEAEFGLSLDGDSDDN